MCATPTAVKSFFLKLIEIFDELDHAQHSIVQQKASSGGFFQLWRRRSTSGEELDEPALRRQAEVGVEVLKQLIKGAAMLDEVDLILHPLKSELNWPLGAKNPLDFTHSRSTGMIGRRWLAPYHIIDAFFYCAHAMNLQGGNGSVNVVTNSGISVDEFAESREARERLEAVRVAIERGVSQKLVQTAPHLVLLSRSFYVAELKGPLARWTLLFLRNSGLRGIDDSQILSYLELGPDEVNADVHSAVLKTVDDEGVKMLNLCSDWLRSLLPFVLGKIDRVSFGLLNPDDLRRAIARDPHTPKSRRLCAVPFIGKDVPSRASEFAQPDVVIGLTILAYRFEGLRPSDFWLVIRQLREAMLGESGPFAKRPSCRLWARWVSLAGARVRGGMSMTDRVAAAKRTNRSEEQLFELLFETDDSLNPDDIYDEIWPLHVIDTRDAEQMGVLYRLLGRVPQVVLHYLHTYIFPETCEHQGLKLSACGQELGGDLVFGRRLGFSGTPSELLPLELGECRYERRSDGKMLSVLTDPVICSSEELPEGWGPEVVLSRCAFGDFHALIDTGALVTGYANRQVAEALLFGVTNSGVEPPPRLPEDRFDGVVFLDDEDRKMILVRQGRKCIALNQSGVPVDRRFSFYDQARVKTTKKYFSLRDRRYTQLGWTSNNH